MQLTTSLAATLLAFTDTFSTATPLKARQATLKFNLGATGPGLSTFSSTFGINDVSYANSSSWLGAIKLQTYSEPLQLVCNDGCDFLSYHEVPTGQQQIYIVPNETQPIGFSVPHAFPPPGVQTTGFAFDASSGVLEVDGQNKFITCQDVAESEINSWPIWWEGDGEPNGVSCLTNFSIVKGDSCGPLE